MSHTWRNIVFRHLISITIIIGAGIGQAYACDASDGRWTNCPDNWDEGPIDTLEPYIHNWTYNIYRDYPAGVPHCSSSRDEKNAYAQWISDTYLKPNGMHLDLMALRVQLSDLTWDFYIYEDAQISGGRPDVLLYDESWRGFLLNWQLDWNGPC
ncbi:hypothetical protein [Luteimonas sp. RC10]|uniref:hypothetical protein n=1 Tax=Luteimonas sp. RC10 TaxID=2587035 RepID=UPI001617A818|nr:hypothetical protein [Luteimonas sp. RC10]MBB3344606.1 hypothetical protein [Luteimonas sp. RC10]